VAVLDAGDASRVETPSGQKPPEYFMREPRTVRKKEAGTS
jgi:hypothetical protein